jgi:thioredoxin-like negative regulator of GroEL
VTSLMLALLLHVPLAGGNTDSYAEAHRVSTETGRPMVIMVSAEWCGACKQMEKNVLPQIKKQDVMEKVSFAVVNMDRDKTLAQKLIGNGPLPQLLMFRKNGNGWLRRKLVGGQSVEAVQKFIQQGVARDEETKKADQQQSPEATPTEAKVAEKPTAQPTETH